MVAVKNPVIKKATLRLLELSGDEKARQVYEDRLQMRRDEYARQQWLVNQAIKDEKIKQQQLVNQAITDTQINIGKKLLAVNTPMDTILLATGLTTEEVNSI